MRISVVKLATTTITRNNEQKCSVWKTNRNRSAAWHA